MRTRFRSFVLSENTRTQKFQKRLSLHYSVTTYSSNNTETLSRPVLDFGNVSSQSTKIVCCVLVKLIPHKAASQHTNRKGSPTGARFPFFDHRSTFSFLSLSLVTDIFNHIYSVF